MSEELILCVYCKVERPRKLFPAVLITKRAGQIRPCKMCSRLRSRLASYGMSLFDFYRLYFQQGRACAICEKPFEDPTELQVDHCHDLGHVRGLLCMPCNVLLSVCKEDKAILISAMQYLQRNLSAGFEYIKKPK